MFNKKHSILNKERWVLWEGENKRNRRGNIWRTLWKRYFGCNDLPKLRYG